MSYESTSDNYENLFRLPASRRDDDSLQQRLLSTTPSRADVRDRGIHVWDSFFRGQSALVTIWEPILRRFGCWERFRVGSTFQIPINRFWARGKGRYGDIGV